MKYYNSYKNFNQRNSMNRFKKLLETDLQSIEEEILEEGPVKFKISFPISDYKRRASNDPELQKEFAKRDTKRAEKEIRAKIEDEVDRPFPLSITVKAKHKSIDKKNSTFEVIVDGLNKDFLNLIKRIKI